MKNRKLWLWPALVLSWCLILSQPLSAQNIDKVEYFIDADPGYGSGTNVPVGTPGIEINNLNFTINTTSLSDGFHTAFFRSRDVNGTWSLTQRQVFFKETLPGALANITYAEYFVDTDPGRGSGVPIAFTPATEVNNLTFSIDVTSLGDGFHTLFFRTRDANGDWSIVNRRVFFKESLPSTLANINYLEYFIDTDPGFGNATSVALSAGTDVQGQAFVASLASIPDGFHTLFLRSRDENNIWSLTNRWVFFKEILPDTLAHIVKMEYFIDQDPGFGQATQIPITRDSVVSGVVANVDVSSLPVGFHDVNLRTQDTLGKWSLTSRRVFFKDTISVTPVSKVEYFIDDDPGIGSATPLTISPGLDVASQSYTLDVSSLADGFHSIGIRSRDSLGLWSLLNRKVFYKEYIPITQPIVSAEYFWDQDPGHGNGVPVSITPQADIQNLMFSANLGGLPAGPHTLFLRTVDSIGRWSLTEFRTPSFPIIIICPSNVFASTDPGMCNAVLSIDTPTYTGATTVTNSINGGFNASGTYAEGTTTVAYNASNLGGNTSSCTFTVTVNDNESPGITCPSSVTLTSTGINCSVRHFYSIQSQDNCPGLNVQRTSGLGSGALFPFGTTNVVHVATDRGSNTLSCSFSVRVDCNTPPLSLTCPGNIGVSTDPGSCDAQVTTPLPTVNNGSGSALITNSYTANPDASGLYSIGNTNVVYTVTDLGRTASCSFNVSVTDNESPGITCPAGFNVSGCSTITTFTSASASDNCPGVNVTQIGGPASGTVFGSGNNIITFRASDGVNTQTCNFTIVVSDIQAPTITCPASRTVTGTGFNCAPNVIYGSPSANDNCAGVQVTRSQGPGNNSNFPEGVNTVGFTATDRAGNTASCSFRITVNCNLPPLVVTCPGSIVTNTDPGRCDAVVTMADPSITNGSGAEVITNNQNGSVNASGLFNEGITTVVYTVVDGNRSGNCSFTVRVNDNQAPQINCPASITHTVITANPTCSAMITYNAATAIDNCPSPLVTRIGGLASGSTFANGVSTITFRVTDAGANADFCSFTITVRCDQLPPLGLSCPPSQSSFTDLSECDAQLTFALPVTQNGSPSEVVLNDFNNSPSASGTYLKGRTTVTYTATDRGRTATCDFTVDVIDNEDPRVFCPGSVTVTGIRNGCNAIATFGLVSATDNCPQINISQIAGGGLASGSIFSDGNTNLVYMATDEAGNTATCRFMVTVNCNPGPPLGIICPADVTIATDPGQCNALTTLNPPLILNGSGLEEITNDYTIGSLADGTYPKGRTTVTYAVLDGIDISTCSFSIEVLDQELPSITCPSTFTVVVTAAMCPFIVTYSVAGDDNCPATTISQLNGMVYGSAVGTGTYPQQYEIVDASGNWATCSFSYTLSCDLPLPLHLLNFNGEARSEGNMLSWHVSEEVNMLGYILERADETGVFVKSFEMLPSHNLREQSYSLLDGAPGMGLKYYRLKMLELDGTHTYSKTVSIDRKQPSGSVWPNPSTGDLYMSWLGNLDGEQLTMSLYDSRGREVKKTEYTSMRGQNTIHLNLPAFEEGIYLIKLHNDLRTIVQERVVINR